MFAHFSVILSSKPLYLDPGSGSIIIQVLLAVILGGGAMIGIYWKKVKAFITGNKEETEKDESSEEDEE